MPLNIIKTPANFFQDGLNFTKKDGTYLIAYPEFLNYFNNVQTITFHEMVIGINFSYGWMPTIFDFRSDRFNDGLVILNNAKAGVLPSNDELLVLKKLFNNSLVGTSKILHFINPIIAPIWDSKVCFYLTGKGNYNDLTKPDLYLEYVKYCQLLINDSQFDNILSHVENQVGYNMTPMRIVELIMYSS